MNQVYKSKSQVRTETEDALQAFLAAGGKIEVVKARKAPKSKMRAKTTKNSSGSTGGFAMGYSRSSFGG